MNIGPKQGQIIKISINPSLLFPLGALVVYAHVENTLPATPHSDTGFPTSAKKLRVRRFRFRTLGPAYKFRHPKYNSKYPKV